MEKGTCGLNFQNEGCDRLYYVFAIFATFFLQAPFNGVLLYRKIVLSLSHFSVRLDYMSCCSQWN